jgi:hypothetical protein
MAIRFKLRTLLLVATVTCLAAALAAEIGWDNLIGCALIASPIWPAWRFGWIGVMGAAVVLFVGVSVMIAVQCLIYQDLEPILYWLVFGPFPSLMWAVVLGGITLGAKEVGLKTTSYVERDSRK